jgi:general secretion pathway protein G
MGASGETEMKHVNSGRPSRGPSRRSAFSLVELLLVMVILAALATIVVPKFAGRSKEARVTAAMTDISNMETALRAFEVDCGRYPTEEEGLQALMDEPADLRNWHGEYLERGVPKDPWGNPYVYVRPGRHNTNGYDLYSFGPNGQEGDDDDVVNWHEE